MDLSIVLFFDLIFILGAAFLAIFVYFKYSFRYWKNKGAPYLEPTFPYGNNAYLLPQTAAFAGEVKDWYDQLKAAGHKFGGAWTFSRKVLVLVDPDYIKDVLSKDFQYFADREFYVNESDPLSVHLFNVRNPAWKPLRQKLTPTFTTGKMKMMLDAVLKCSDYMVDYMTKSSRIGDDVEIREILASFTTDVIGSVAFGVECNSFEKTHAEFREQGKELFRVTRVESVLRGCARIYPEIARMLRISSTKAVIKRFFADLVRQSIDYRTKNNVSRPDFLQLLMDMNKEGQNGQLPIEFEQIVANCILFFIAGFDTSSTAMTFALYELARNPTIQDKTREEIKTVLEKHGGKITYEALQDMTYLKQVLDESMRLYPSLVTLARICTKNYRLRDTEIVVEKGTPVVISTLGLGRDPDHFPDPERFDPDRFGAEQKARRHPFVHIPFGEGPRNCIGLRFGVMQTKIGLVRILTNFRLSVSPKTKQPVTLNMKHFLLKENNPIYLTVEKIQE